MINDAILIRREALDCRFNLHVGLLAFDRQAYAPGEGGYGGDVVGAGNADMVDPLDQRRSMALDCQRRREEDADARGGSGVEGLAVGAA